MSDAPKDPQQAEGEEPSEEAVWQDLVSRLETNSEQHILGPEQQATEVQKPSEQRPRFQQFDPLNVQNVPETVVSAAGPRDYTVPEDEEDFVPAEPASLATVGPAIGLAWLGAAGIPLALLCAAIFWREAPLLLIVAAIVVFLLAVGYLVYRLPRQRDSDDDGAQV